MAPEFVAEQILKTCDQVEKHLDAIMASAPGAIRTILDNARPFGLPLPDFVKDTAYGLIMDALRELEKVVREAIAFFRELAMNVGTPSVLRDAADAYEAGVLTPGTTLAGAIKPSDLSANDSQYWDSDAADGYDDAIAEQMGAVDAVPETARAMVQVLNGMADSIDGFYDSLDVAVVSLALAVAGFVLAVLTLETVVVAIIALIVAIISLIVAIISLVMTFMTAASTNATLAANLTATPAIDWPQTAFAA